MGDFLKTKKILITGAGGFLGAYVVRNLLEKKKVPKWNLFLPSAQTLDLRRWDHCKSAVRNQDVVIHLAAVTGNSEFHQLNPGKVFYENAIMGVQIVEAARQAGVEKFVGIGSVTAYPKKAHMLIKEDALWQGYPEGVHAPYSFAKMMLLVQGQTYRKQYNFCAIHLLLTNLYGSGMKLKDGYVIASLIQKIDNAKRAKKKSIKVWGTGRESRDFLYGEDAADGIVLASERYAGQDPVNIASGREIYIKDLANLLCRLMNFNGKISWEPSKAKDEQKRRLDISKAKTEFGFSPQTTLEEGLLKTIKWYDTRRL